MDPECAVQLRFSLILVFLRSSCIRVAQSALRDGRESCGTGTLPCARVSLWKAQAPAGVPVPHKGAEEILRVLVVEDEASLARQLTAALRRAGYAVDHAA